MVKKTCCKSHSILYVQNNTAQLINFIFEKGDLLSEQLMASLQHVLNTKCQYSIRKLELFCVTALTELTSLTTDSNSNTVKTQAWLCH